MPTRTVHRAPCTARGALVAGMLDPVELPTPFYGLKVSAVLSADDVEAALIFTGIDGEPVIAIGDLMLQAAEGDKLIQLLARLRERVRELPTVDRGPWTADGP